MMGEVLLRVGFLRKVERTQGGRYWERMAEALRDAVKKLRTKGGMALARERWVKFVHYGA